MLDQLLERGHQYSAEYQAGLSNHLPMTLIALDRMGASKDQLEAFYDSYIGRLARLQLNSEEKITAENWKSFLGNHEREIPYQQFFENELRIKGVEHTLKRSLGVLIQGLAGGAFHPMIRLAYAVEHGSEQGLAHALAAWAMAYLPLRELTAGQRFDDPRACLENISKHSELGASRKGLLSNLFQRLRSCASNIFTRMKLVAEDDSFTPYADCLKINESTLEEIAAALIELYGCSHDHFTLLHGVTSCHAMRLLKPYLEDWDKALRYYWQAIIAAYVTTSSIELKTLKPSKAPDWKVILNKAVTSTNDHTIKFVYTCWQEDQAYSNSAYRQLAAIRAKC